MVYKEPIMQRTQIYLDESLVADLKKIAKSLNVSMSEFIRSAVKKELKQYKQNDLIQFIDSLQPLESFKETDNIKYVESIRDKSRTLR